MTQITTAQRSPVRHKLVRGAHRGRRLIICRIIGWMLLLTGAAVLVRDVVAYFQNNLWTPLALGQLWYTLDRSSLNLVQAVIQRYVSPFLWDRVIVALLLCWASAVLLGLGAFVLVLARHRRPPAL
jgi:hypothetical protein